MLGRDILPDATLGLKGATGSSENKLKDKLRVITKDKEINIIEEEVKKGKVVEFIKDCS